MDLADELKAAVAPAHATIEALPLSRALADATVTRAGYIALLGQLWHVHDAVEAELDRHALPLYRREMARRETLARDRAALGADGPVGPPTAATEALAARIRSWSADEPAALLGALYVLEGSKMGSMVLARTVARALGVPPGPGRGLDYHLTGIADRPQAWRQFRGEINALELTAAERAAVLRGATATMAGLVGLYETIGGL
jgi:heme oxygenase